MNVTDGWKVRYYCWCVVLCKKKKQNREPNCVVKREYPFLNVPYARVYFYEVDADKLESRSLFINGVNVYVAEDWESWKAVYFAKSASCRNCCTLERKLKSYSSIFSFDIKCFAFQKIISSRQLARTQWTNAMISLS